MRSCINRALQTLVSYSNARSNQYELVIWEFFEFWYKNFKGSDLYTTVLVNVTVFDIIFLCLQEMEK